VPGQTVVAGEVHVDVARDRVAPAADIVMLRVQSVRDEFLSKAWFLRRDERGSPCLVSIAAFS
jgi:hypothetical protein